MNQKANNEARKKQDFSSNQCSDADRRDKQRTYSLSACFKAVIAVLSGRYQIALQSIESQKRVSEGVFDEKIAQNRASDAYKRSLCGAKRVHNTE